MQPGRMRVCSRKRVDTLIDGISEWRAGAATLSKQIIAKRLRVSTRMQILDGYQITAFRGGNAELGSMGFIRCLGIVFDCTLINDESEWHGFDVCR